jgi:hypothetical protein
LYAARVITSNPERNKKGGGLKLREKYEGWKGSIDGVLYDLAVVGDVARVDVESKYLIARTLLKLPKKVGRRVLEEATFVISGGAYGTVVALNLKAYVVDRLVKSGRIDPSNKDSSVTYSYLLNMDIRLPLIILNFAAMEGKSEREKMAIIAHEIAHYVLGCSGGDKAEKEADDLIEKWGFPSTYGIA